MDSFQRVCIVGCFLVVAGFGKSTAQIYCTSNSDCSSYTRQYGTKMTCDRGVCVYNVSDKPKSECSSDYDCAYGKECSNEKCIKKPSSPSGCTSDAECGYYEECNYYGSRYRRTGRCVPIPNNPTPKCRDDYDCGYGEYCSRRQVCKRELRPQPTLF